jgi:hypothetical protein
MQLSYHRTPVFDQLIKKKKPFITALDRKCSVNIPKPKMRVPEFAPVKLSGTNYRNPQYSDSVSDQRIEIHLPDGISIILTGADSLSAARDILSIV